MGPVAVGLFAPELRGRVVGALSIAGSLALVLGVPAGTWVGRQSDWLGPVFMVAQNQMLHCAPGRTDIALAANSGAYTPALRLAPHSGRWSCRSPGCEAHSSPAGC